MGIFYFKQYEAKRLIFENEKILGFKVKLLFFILERDF